MFISMAVSAGEFEDKAKEQFETSSRFSPPMGWAGPKFELSRAYPPLEPMPEANLPWMDPGSDFRIPGEEPEYMKRVLAYCLEGNVEVDFKVQDNVTRKWYHTPWMHFGPAGREPIRGLTRERPAPIKFLHDNQTRRVQNWAVGFYNAPGGFVIGKFWEDPAQPNSAMPRFPVGTAVFKLLFTNATDTEVPYIAETVSWDAMINATGPAPGFAILGSRVLTPVPMSLLQIDIAVRDERADTTTGWVFGTFVYNVALKQPGDTPWQRLMPVGIMWGNDPMFTPAPGSAPGEAWLNPDAVSLLTTSVRTTLGFQGRVNGPVDNPLSSCLSCHSTAQDKPAPIMFERRNDNGVDPFYGGLSRSEWFRNLKPADPFKAGEKSLDYSLQLAGGLESFNEWKADNFESDLSPKPAARRSAPQPRIVHRDDDAAISADDPNPSDQVTSAPPADPVRGLPRYVWAILAVALLAVLMLMIYGVLRPRP